MRLPLGPTLVDLDTGVVTTAEGEVQLTTTERELLAYLAQRPGQAVDRDELHAEVWEHGPQVLSRALDTTVRRLRKKLELDPRNPRHLQTVHGVGYRLLVSDASQAERALALIGELDARSRRSVPRAWIEALPLLRRSVPELLGAGRIEEAARVGLATARVLRRVGPYGDVAPLLGPILAADPGGPWVTLLRLELWAISREGEHLEAARAEATEDRALQCRVAMAGGLAEVREAAEMAAQLPFLRGQAAGQLACMLHRIDPDESQRWFVDALAMAQEDGDTWEEAVISGNFAGLLRTLGELDMAERYYMRAVERLEQLGDDWNRQVALGGLGTLRFQRFDLDGAERAMVSAHALAKALGRDVGAAVSIIDQSAIRLTRRLEVDVLELEEAMGVMRRAGHRLYVAIAQDNLGWCWLQRGQLGLARSFVERAIRLAEELQEPLHVAEMRTHLAEVLWLEGRQTEAWAMMEASVAVLEASPVRQPPALLARLLQASWAPVVGEAVPEASLRRIVAGIGETAPGLPDGIEAWRWSGDPGGPV